MSIHSFIHSGHFYFKSSTTHRRSRLQNGYCIGVSRRIAQATAGKGLAQGPYVTARAGVEPTTLRLKVNDSTKAPSRPTRGTCVYSWIFKKHLPKCSMIINLRLWKNKKMEADGFGGNLC